MDLANSYYFWLVPQKKIFIAFQKIINQLSLKYSTPSFEPHVTIVSGLSGDECLLLKKIDAFADNQKIISTHIRTLDYQEGFFKALFINIQKTPELIQLNKDASAYLNPFGQTEYLPHLSLLYGKITIKEKNEIISQLTLPFKALQFDKLKLIKGNSDVKKWCVIKTWDLNVF